MPEMRNEDAVRRLPKLRISGEPDAEKSQRQKSLWPDGPRRPYIDHRAFCDTAALSAVSRASRRPFSVFPFSSFARCDIILYR